MIWDIDNKKTFQKQSQWVLVWKTFEEVDMQNSTSFQRQNEDSFYFRCQQK